MADVLQPLNLAPLFEALGIQPPPAVEIPPFQAEGFGEVPPMPAEAPALVPAAAAAEAELDTDWTTIYQDGPDYPEYTMADIPGALMDAVQDARSVLVVARAAEGASNNLKNQIYWNVKGMFLSLMNALVGNLEDVQTCWHESHAAVWENVEEFGDNPREALEARMAVFLNSFQDFVEWIRDTMTPEGLGTHVILPEIYHHYVRHTLRYYPEEEGEEEEMAALAQAGAGVAVINLEGPDLPPWVVDEGDAPDEPNVWDEAAGMYVQAPPPLEY